MPLFKSQGECVVISHSELFDWPLGKLNFTVGLTASVNPGLATFPWLSGVANNFETYRFRRLKFVYYPRCAATQAGQIIMLLDPKSSDANPRTLQIASTYHIRANGNMWAPLELVVPQQVLDTGGPRKLIRSHTLQADAAALYDVGRFMFITDGANPFDAVVGELGLEYEVELYTPGQRPAGAVPSMYIDGTSSGASASNIFGNVFAAGGLLFDDLVGNIVALKNLEVSGVNQLSEYTIWVYLVGTGISAIVPTFSNATVVTPYTVMIQAGSTVAMLFWTFRPTAGIGTVSIAVTATTITEGNLIISQVPYDISF